MMFSFPSLPISCCKRAEGVRGIPSLCGFEVNETHCNLFNGTSCFLLEPRGARRLVHDDFSDPTRPASNTTAFLLMAPPPSPPSSPAEALKDPHLLLAHGGRADFRGRDGGLYNFLSTRGLAFNVKTEDATFTLHGGKLTVDGSFITEAHVVARVGGAKRKTATASFWGAELNEFNTGWRVVNGSCGYNSVFTLAMGEYKACEELEVRVRFSSATFSVRGWVLRVRGNYVFGHISGPTHRLDLTLSARGGAVEAAPPHGIVGQSFADDSPRTGAKDVYPSEGRFKTSAMAEGAIEGSAAMYEVATAYSTVFAFSRFDPPKGKAAAAETDGRSGDDGLGEA